MDRNSRPFWHPRRWFRFNLRTLFVAVTLLGLWLAWQLSIVRDRREFLQTLKDRPGIRVTLASARAAWIVSNEPVARIPLVRRWLGDEAVQEFWYTTYYQAPSADEMSKMTKLFPEAKLREALPPPCHPGCFPRGTWIETPVGLALIETVAPGDFVTTIDAQGDRSIRSVESVFVTDNRLWEVTTEVGVLHTTQTQPLCVSVEQLSQAGDLDARDTVLYFENGATRSLRVLGVSETDRTEQVYNLILGDCEIFIANGFLARSKPPAKSSPP